MFGLSWLFGALTIAEASIVFQWLFVIFNSLQGFFLFIFFCVIGKDARDEWIQLFTCGRKNNTRRSTYSGPASRSRPRKQSESYISAHTRTATFVRGTDLSCDVEDGTMEKPTLELTSVTNGYSVMDPNILSEADEPNTIFANEAVILEEPENDTKVMETIFKEEKGSLETSELPLKPKDIQVPPHILARLRNPHHRTYYDGIPRPDSSKSTEEVESKTLSDVVPVNTDRKTSASEVPPHVLARLRGPYHHLQEDSGVMADRPKNMSGAVKQDSFDSYHTELGFELNDQTDLSMITYEGSTQSDDSSLV